MNTEDPTDRTWYQANDDDPRHLLAARQDSGAAVGSAKFEKLDNYVKNVTYRAVDDSTVKIEFDVVGDDNLDLHLYSQELPGPGGNPEIPWGPTYDVTEGTFSGSENVMTANLPTL